LGSGKALPQERREGVSFFSLFPFVREAFPKGRSFLFSKGRIPDRDRPLPGGGLLMEKRELPGGHGTPGRCPSPRQSFPPLSALENLARTRSPPQVATWEKLPDELDVEVPSPPPPLLFKNYGTIALFVSFSLLFCVELFPEGRQECFPLFLSGIVAFP